MKYVVDSRFVKSGNTFFCLKGARVDGHDYLEEVAKKGAIRAFVHKSYQGKDYGLLLSYVPDVLRALQDLASEKLKTIDATIIAVTGSVGKTTTKEFLRTLIAEEKKVFASPGNANSQIGLPLTILNHVQGNEEVLIFEMGMTHPGQIARLVEIAPPDFALITSVELVHAENFESLSDIAKAKGEIFSNPKTNLGILPEALFEDLRECGSCPKKTFGFVKSDYLMEVKRREAKIGDLSFTIPFIEEHLDSNLLATCAIAKEMGISDQAILNGIQKMKLPEMRLERVERDGVLFINDSYNASVTAIKGALKMLPKLKREGRLIAVLGEETELGKFSKQGHVEIGQTALETVDQLFCLGEGCKPIHELWQKEKKPIFWTDSREVLFKKLQEGIAEGDVVLLKGKNTQKLWEFLDLIDT